MPSQVEICRLALAHIADAARVNSIDPPDNTAQAQYCATFFPIARDECLEAFDWPFAIRRVALTESLTALDNAEWLFAYNVPSDYIRALKVLPPGSPKDEPGHDYILESDITELDLLIRTNVPGAVLHYVYRETETGRYSPLFVSALAYLLASYLAGPILKGRVGTAVKDSMFQMFSNYIRRAAAAVSNAQQRNDQYATHRPSWVADR